MKFKKVIILISVIVGVLLITNPDINDFKDYMNAKENPSGICELESGHQQINFFVFSIYESHYECYLSSKEYLVDKNDTSFNYLEVIKSDDAVAAYIGVTHVGVLETFIDF